MDHTRTSEYAQGGNVHPYIVLHTYHNSTIYGTSKHDTSSSSRYRMIRYGTTELSILNSNKLVVNTNFSLS